MAKNDNNGTCLINNPNQILSLEPIKNNGQINTDLENYKIRKLRSIYLLKTPDTTEQEFKKIVEDDCKSAFLKTGKVLFYVSNHIAKVVYDRGLSLVKSCLDCKQIEQRENIFGEAKKAKEQTININGSKYNWKKHILKNSYKISVIVSSSFSSKGSDCSNNSQQQQQILSIIQQYKSISAQHPTLSEAEISEIMQKSLNQLSSKKEIQSLVSESEQKTECPWECQKSKRKKKNFRIFKEHAAKQTNK
ncbi:hypothetical protein ABPG72_012314 [Tetrahymena utriculariae]